jgi:YggT family protein
VSVFLQRPLYGLGTLYLLVLVVRAVLSWFPIAPRSPLSTINHVAYVLTEPVVAPFRKVIPPAGVFDVSYIVAMLTVWLLTDYVLYHVKV